MNLSFILQFLSSLIASGYIDYDIIKINRIIKLIEQSEKEADGNAFNNENQSWKEILMKLINNWNNGDYTMCDEFLSEILYGWENDVYFKLKKYFPSNKQEYIEMICLQNHYPELNPLIDKLIKHIEPEHLTRLMLNIVDLQIEHKKKKGFQLFSNLLGDYDVIANIICLYNESQDVLSHEFLHMASTIVTKESCYIGFCIDNEMGKLFNGLNEGYTELLNKKIFNAEFIGYQLNFIACQLLETMFDDKQELEIAYFNNDIDVFINKFLSYGTTEELNIILQELDHLIIHQHTFEVEEELLDMICEIVGRKHEPDKILRCKEIRHENKCKKSEIPIKKLVKNLKFPFSNNK